MQEAHDFMSMIKISVITVSYNSRPTIEACLHSVMSQTHQAVEYIVIDGCSTDGTPDIIMQYGDRISHLLVEPDSGAYDAMNKGLRLATGDVVGILNGDDLYADVHVLARVAKTFNDPEIDTCYGDLVYVDQADTEQVVRYWKAGDYSRARFFSGWMPPHPTFFVRRQLYERYGTFNLGLGTAADYELMLRFLFKYGVSAAYIPEVLVKMRLGGKSNASLKNRIAANRMDRRAWQVNALKPRPWTLWMKPIRKIPQWLVRPKL